MDKWEENNEIKKHAGTIIRSFGGMFQALMKSGVMTVREKELVALGIAIAEMCKPCIFRHVEKCLQNGVNRDEIIETAGVAVMMRGGPAFAYMSEVFAALDCYEK